MSEGPRRGGDQKSDLPPDIEYAQSLPPKVTDKYVLFYGWEGPYPEVCLQQWYPTRFYDPDALGGGDDDDDDDDDDDEEEPTKDSTPQYFHTTEQYMMYWKALLMGDDEMALKIADCKTPAEAKEMGRQVKHFDKEVWDNNCDMVVERGNLFKFDQNEKLKKVLLETGDRILVEASPNDRIWGVGFNTEQALGKEDQWGENKLGKALMRVREQLKANLKA